MRSWKLNEAKSKIVAGVAKNNEWTGKFDGKDYLVTGDPTTDTRSVTLVKAGHCAIINKGECSGFAHNASCC